MKIIPEIIKTQAKNQKIKNTVSNLINSLDNKLEIEKDENAISFVPPFARYPYEIWIAPFKRVDCANQLADKEIISIAKLLISSVKRLDHLFGKPMPYTMAVHFPPRGYENNFHHYISFQPMRSCLLYTSDAADEGLGVDLGGRRIIKKEPIKKRKYQNNSCLLYTSPSPRD